ncbi:MAG: hypothetical protein IT287_08110 [Bdellovibrionaceae bacterium]|nr:hypothetical protein [Pseudobdellovibrionaceae bacterium]
MKIIFSFLFFLILELNTAFAGETELIGFVKIAATGADHAVESLGRNNFVAYTAAANPVLSAHPDKSSFSMQAQQSRIGIKHKIDDSTFAIVEADFVDFNKSTPTVASLARLRRAVVNYKANEEWSYNIGQDWDLFSPYAPYTYNYIGHYFLSGDTGFMRLQAQALRKKENSELGFALGFPSYNNQSAVGNTEWSVSPTLSARQTWKWDEFSFGGSVIVGHIKDATSSKSITPYALNIFSKKSTLTSDWVFEAYFGENLENLSLQALSYSPNFVKLQEAGGFMTYHKRYDSWGWFTGAGYASILNNSHLTSSYSYTAGKPTLNLLTVSTGYGIRDNATLRMGVEKYLSSKTHIYFEVAHLYTHHVLEAQDNAIKAHRSATVFEFGIKAEL